MTPMDEIYKALYDLRQTGYEPDAVLMTRRKAKTFRKWEKKFNKRVRREERRNDIQN